MEHMHSSLDRCLFLLPISIHAIYKQKHIFRIIKKSRSFLLRDVGISQYSHTTLLYGVKKKRNLCLENTIKVGHADFII